MPQLLPEQSMHCNRVSGECQSAAMTIDRRLRSGTAPNQATLAIWLLTAVCMTISAVTWRVPQADNLAPLLLSTVVGCAALAAVMFAFSRTAWRLLGREAAVATCLMVPLNPLVLEVFLPGPFSGATWSLAATALCVGCLSLRQADRGAALAGALMATGCATATLWPVAAIIGVVLFVRWLADQRAAGQFSAFVKAFVAVSMPILATQHWLAGEGACASRHLAQAAALLSLLAGTMILERIPRLAPAALAGSMAGVAVMAVCLAAAVPDACGAPVSVFATDRTSSELAVAFIPALTGLGACWYLLRHNEAWLRRWWSEYAAILGVAALGGLVVPELAAVAALLAAMPLGWLAAQLALGHQRMRGKGWLPASFAALLVMANVINQTAAELPSQAKSRSAVLAAVNAPAG
jgi:hypothetical protein